jgi:ribosomal protein L40E
MGRVVRTLGDGDHSRAYVVMPTHKVFEEYARRVEREMHGVHIPEPRTTKICPICEEENSKDAQTCVFCEYEFPVRKQRFKSCDQCEGLSPIGAKECQHCGSSFEVDFDITLNEALRLGAIVRGMDVDEEDVREGERIGERLYDHALEAGDEVSLQILSQFPKEGIARFLRLAEEAKRAADDQEFEPPPLN